VHLKQTKVSATTDDAPVRPQAQWSSQFMYRRVVMTHPWRTSERRKPSIQAKSGCVVRFPVMRHQESGCLSRQRTGSRPASSPRNASNLVLGLLFLEYISDSFERRRKVLEAATP
jgi:hypothetical protein